MVGFEDFIVNIGDRIFFDEFVKMLGVEDDIGFMRFIDKKDKMSREEFVGVFREFGLNDDGVEKVFLLIEIKGFFDEVFLKVEEFFMSEEVKVEIKRFYEFVDFFDVYGVFKWVRIDFGIVCGFDYYISVVFEVIVFNDFGIGFIGGGGCYDNFIEVFGGKLIL